LRGIGTNEPARDSVRDDAGEPFTITFVKSRRPGVNNSPGLQLLAVAVRGVGGWVGGWVDGWMDGWMDGWVKNAMERETGVGVCSECVSQCSRGEGAWKVLGEWFHKKWTKYVGYSEKK